MSEPLDARMDFRINETEKEDYIEGCGKINKKPQPFLREMIRAFNSGRLRIIPTDQQVNARKEIYHDN